MTRILLFYCVFMSMHSFIDMIHSFAFPEMTGREGLQPP